MSGSLRGRLLVTILALVVPVVVVLSGALYWAVQDSIWSKFEADLVDLGATYNDLVEYDEEGYECELGPHPAPPTRGPGNTTYVQIWGPQGEELGRTRELGDEHLPNAGGPLGHELGDARLADGRSLRTVTYRFIPKVDEDTRPGTPPPEAVTLVLAREIESTSATLSTVGWWFVALGFITLGAASFASWWATGRGLEPVDTLAEAIHRVDDRALGKRLYVQALPRELVPIVRRTNALLDRLQGAFDRERRFTADVAHELRTPLTVLRTSIELSLRKERTGEAYRNTLTENLDTVTVLSTLVDNLLALSRMETEEPVREFQTVHLAELVRGSWAHYERRAAQRNLTFSCTIDPGATVESDRELLRLIVNNLLSNAAVYTERGGWVRVEHVPDSKTILTVVDSGPPIPTNELPHVFERFWRAEDARSDSAHCGIGLSLVESVSRRLGLRAVVDVRNDGSVAFGIVDEADTNPA